MKKISITIPDNLDKNQEILEIAKQLSVKLLPNDGKLIGIGYDIKNLETQINIKRVATEKQIQTIDCPICNTITEKKIAKTLWTNYGGKVKKHHYCSDNCRETMIQITGIGRASIKKKDLLPLNWFFKKLQ